MVKIDRKVRDVISHIKIAEAQKEHLQNKIEGSEPQVSVDGGAEVDDAGEADDSTVAASASESPAGRLHPAGPRLLV